MRAGGSRRYTIAFVLASAALLVACTTAVREPPERDDPLTRSSPSLEQGVERFLLANLGESVDGLALSGGGQNGAYGAGLLVGWQAADIPRFDLVTGVSTGALIASHAFLDTEADARTVARFYTSIEARDILCRRNAIAGITSDAFASMVPLERRIAEVVSDDLIDRVAAASEDGKRLLLVGTVNLDTGGYRIWDLGAMARARQYEKYRAVLRASAGPPVAVPPVYLEGGMHCDGSTASSLFVPFAEDLLDEDAQARVRREAAERGLPLPRVGTLHVVVNGLREPSTVRVRPAVIDIAERSLDVMGYSLRLGNLWYLYARLRDANGEFRLRFLPDDLREDAEDFLAFDRAKMKRIYERGVRDARDPSIWETEPPPLRPDRSAPRPAETPPPARAKRR